RSNWGVMKTASGEYQGGLTSQLWEVWQESRACLANREAQPVAVTDEMALAFHRALNDGGIGESDLEEIKVGLRGALCNITAPPAPAVPEEMTGGIAMSKYKVKKSNYSQWVKGWNACRAAMLKGEKS
ncbi:hypothetical protein, partial [Serratia sp. (in: enterobacteria)]|uniref:hypothetical protein n=1 Tax=Serratia sp. (in: enterobacteria) TaxID=616 RepID=UPI003F2F96E0